MKSFLEWYLGIPPAQPGQGTQWTWLRQTPWPASAPPWLVVIVLLAVAASIIWVYRRDARTVALPWRIVLTGLRLASIAFVLLILTELTLVVDRTGLPFIAVLIDDSASMSLDDQYTDPSERTAVRTLLRDQPGARTTRLSIAQELLTGSDAAFLKQLQKRHQLRVYRFSETASVLGGTDAEQGGDLGSLVGAIKRLEPTGSATSPAQAVRKVLNDFRGSLPSAIVVVSDGISSSGEPERLTVGADLAARRFVPLYTVGVGSEEAMHDLNLYDTLADEVAFVNDPVTLTAKLKSFGFSGQNIAVVLKEKESGTVLGTTKVKAGKDGQTVPVELTWAPDTAGDYELVLEASPQQTEIDRSNNAETRQISVREEKLRVLLVDSLPRWEFRELKTLLERETTVELHTILQDADLEFVDQDATAQPLRGRFPVSREQLFAYDVVIFGDVNIDSLSPSTLQNLNAFVSEAGGGVIFVAGPHFNPLAYRNTVLADLLPVELDGVTLPSPNEYIPVPFQPVLTLEGQKSTPIFRFDTDERNSLAVWRNLPGFYWLATVQNVKPGATVFVEHPTRMGDGRHLPVITLQRFGAGKVIFHATDETWLWRRRVGDLYYGRYWIQAIRYLSRSRLLGQSKSAELKSDRLVYRNGETVTLRLRFFSDDELPETGDEIKAVVERRDGGNQEVVLTRIPQAPNVFEGQLRRASDGSYHAWIASQTFVDTPPATDFRVESPENELRIRGLDRQQLSEAAKISGGQFYTLATASSLPADVPRGRPVPIRSEDPIRIWNRWEVLLLFAALLTTEWLLRKRARLV
jgi:uncharacterized membrane protein